MDLLNLYSCISVKLENNEMLEFAKLTFSDEQYYKIKKAYKKLFWFQISMPISSSIIVAFLCIIFPKYAEEIALIGAVVFLILFILWLIISQFIGGLWHRYVKLYKNSYYSAEKIIHELFEK